MQDRTHELVRRVESLERKNRRLTRWGALAAVLALGGGLMSMRTVCDTVSAERFVLVDPEGKQRAVLTAYETGGAPKFTLLDNKGRAVATLATDADGAYLALSDAKGEKSVRFAANGDGDGPAGVKSAEKKPETARACDGVGATVAEAAR